MIHQLALIAVLALSQSLCAVSDQAKAPEPNQATDSNAPQVTTDLNAPSQVPIPAIVNHTIAQKANLGSADGSKEARNEIQEAGSSGPALVEERSIRAQENMALSAWCLFGVACIQLIASSLGIWLIWQTLISSREATKTAMKSANAAMDSAESAKQVIFSDRAYMTIDGIHPKTEGYGSYFVVQWINCGRSPAIIMGETTEYRIAESEKTTPDFDCSARPIGGLKLGPNQKFPCYTPPIDKITATRITEEDATAYVLAALEYSDIFHRNIEERAIFKYTQRNGCDDVTLVSWDCSMKCQSN